MRDLQQVRASDSREHLRFRLTFDVAGQQRRQMARADVKNHRAVVLGCAPKRMFGRVRCDAERSDPSVIAVARQMDADVAIERRFQDLLRADSPELPRRYPHLGHVEPPDDRWQSAAMIRMHV